MVFEHRPPGLVDVAAKAGVSLSTVSRVITGRTPVSASLRVRVMEAVDELGYRPNAAAQTLVSGRRSTIARIFARNTTRYGYAETLHGIEEAARSAGYVVMIAVIDSGDPEEIARAVDLTLSQPLAGAIVIEFDDVGISTLKALPDIGPRRGCGRRTTARRKSGRGWFLDSDKRLGGGKKSDDLNWLGHQRGPPHRDPRDAGAQRA